MHQRRRTEDGDLYKDCIQKSLYIGGDNSLQWWPENNNYNNNNNTTQDLEYDYFDADEIELEWWTKTNNETETNILNTTENNS